jgi:hypothetical protein
VVGPATLAGLDVTALGGSREALLVLGFLTGRRVSRAGGGKPDCSRIVRILANKRRYSRRNIGEEVREGREEDARGVGGTLPEEAHERAARTRHRLVVAEAGRCADYRLQHAFRDL